MAARSFPTLLIIVKILIDEMLDIWGTKGKEETIKDDSRKISMKKRKRRKEKDKN